MKSAACIYAAARAGFAASMAYENAFTTFPSLEWYDETEQTRMHYIMNAEAVAKGEPMYGDPGARKLFAAVVHAVCANWPEEGELR